MGEIKWEEPQPVSARNRRSSTYAPMVEELKKRPGQWAVVAEDAAPTITSYLKKVYGVEATARGVKNGRAEKIYARWPECAAA